MSLLDIFKAKWSARDMTPENRRKVFWFLKRKSSYSAWRRQAEAFDRFAEIYTKQVREEPVTKAAYRCDDTNWEFLYPKVLRAQVCYEKGLTRLRDGDRTIWLCSERGILGDANMLAGDWYSDLVNHGMRGDHFYDGKYLSELTEAIRLFSATCRDTAAIIQPMMAETPAHESWSTFWDDEFAKLPLPALLPEVPIPTTQILVRTGEETPFFGIYEPQIRDGCMNYLLGGVPAPTMWESDGTYATGKKLSVVWRLIWEDNRYFNGQIPPEEEHYFSPEGSVVAPVIAPVEVADKRLGKDLTGDKKLSDGSSAAMAVKLRDIGDIVQRNWSALSEISPSDYQGAPL